MVAMPAVEHPRTEDDVLRAFLELETPAGFKAELIEGEIVVTPPPDGSHETAFALLNRQFMRRAAVELDLAGTKGLVTPKGRFIPDGTVSPVGHFETADSWASPAGVLLVDRTDGNVTLFTDPEDGDYTAHVQVPFGKPLDLPAPFSFALDTAPLR
ncbi:hypothetical protein GCM10018781_24560 [Kitasatospora indigofera]|uniref:Putative restriction endonuclease domain-containing protein n=1 Tax=Kitasatospora indigofera TaxID=67307 RepID=A0A919FLD6_9ACTN|nr:Uma2 family endonuclease [Kitasatospora indigofera]GHH68241.1 hypothetical protein GCM10018781_24560 [Kitasatospora indigofera]